MDHWVSSFRECYRASQRRILAHCHSSAGWGFIRKADTEFSRPLLYRNSRLEDRSRTADTGLPAHTASSSAILGPQAFWRTHLPGYELYKRVRERSDISP